MERLTDKCWRNLDPWECCGQDNFCKRGCHDVGGCNNGCIVPKLYARLAAYEDTGLEPEDIKTVREREDGLTQLLAQVSCNCAVTYTRLRELAQADWEGRVVVLPCKVGESLWVHDRDGKPREMELDPPDIRCHCKKEDNLCMETKLQKRDREIDYFRRRTNEVLAENERLAQDLRYITQQMEKDPIGTDGVAVRIPGRANQTDGVICTTVFILRPERDPAAVAAIRAYAAETENQLTRYRLMAWIGETEGPEPKVPTAVDIIADSLEERERRLEAEKFER